jgi:uroporphyrinogen decarboxylase
MEILFPFSADRSAGITAQRDKEAIRKEIRYRCEVLGANGGYLLAPAHILQADVTPETIKVMIDAAREFGQY